MDVTTPVVGAMDSEDVYPLPDVVETRKSVGGVIFMALVKLMPDTV